MYTDHLYTSIAGGSRIKEISLSNNYLVKLYAAVLLRHFQMIAGTSGNIDSLRDNTRQGEDNFLSILLRRLRTIH